MFSDTRLLNNGLKDDLICPATREIFTDPGLASDGNTYEPLAITTWLKGNHNSPITSQHLKKKDIEQ